MTADSKATRPLSVVFCVAAFFPHPLGASYSAHRLARGLRDLGLAVRFVVDRGLTKGAYDRPGGAHDGFPVRSFWWHEPGKWRKLCGLAALAWHLFRTRRTYDVIHVQGGGHMNLLIAGLARLVSRRPVMLKITLDGWDSPDAVRRQEYGRLLAVIYRRLDGVVAMTKAQEEKCLAFGLRGITATIPNGVDCARFRPVNEAEKNLLRRELEISSNAKVLVYAGVLDQRKGVDLLFKLWARLRVRHPDLVLLTVGDFQTNLMSPTRLQEAFASWGLDPAWAKSPTLRMHGKVDDLQRYLQASDVFVFPSRREGFGTVQIEAMACGLPCVVSNLPGITSDLFPDPSAGIPVLVDHLDGFAEATDRLLCSADLRHQMGAAGRARAESVFSADSVARRYMSFYNRLLSV